MGECVRQRAEHARAQCQKHCPSCDCDRSAASVRTECAFAFCASSGQAARTLGEACMVADQECGYDPDVPKHATRCAEGLRCATQFEADRVGRCLPPGAKPGDPRPLLPPDGTLGVQPTGRWSRVFVGCAAPRMVCRRPPTDMVSAERTEQRGVDAAVCSWTCGGA